MNAEHVWVMQLTGHYPPRATRYTLLTRHPKGGVTVVMRSKEHFIPPASNRRFFFAEADLVSFVTRVMREHLESLQRSVQTVSADMAEPWCNMDITEVPDLRG